MSKADSTPSLAPATADYVASAVNAALGSVPFVGSLLIEIAGTVIPNQRIDRIARFAQKLEERISDLEQEFVRSQVHDDTFTDLMEEALRQSARSTSDTRIEHIARLISSSLNAEQVSHIEAKHLLTTLGELNDIEIIRLGSYQYNTMGSGSDYREKHKAVLQPIRATMASPQEDVDRETLQNSYDQHLARVGLLRARYKLDRNKEPQYNSSTGAQEIASYELAPFGRLLLRHIGLYDRD